MSNDHWNCNQNNDVQSNDSKAFPHVNCGYTMTFRKNVLFFFFFLMEILQKQLWKVLQESFIRLLLSLNFSQKIIKRAHFCNFWLLSIFLMFKSSSKCCFYCKILANWFPPAAADLLCRRCQNCLNKRTIPKASRKLNKDKDQIRLWHSIQILIKQLSWYSVCTKL